MSFERRLLFDLVEKVIDNRGKTPPFSAIGYPQLEVKHIISGRLYPIVEDTKFVSQDTWDTWFRAHLKPLDILFTTVGSIARSCLVPPKVDFCIAQNIIALRINSKIADPRFVYYALRDPQFLHEVDGRTIATVQDSIKVADLRTCRIPMPPLVEQRRIAHILGTLDDKIELNRRMNETLEAMAQALFKSWFVDATQDGLPEGWRAAPLDSVANFLNGLALQKFPPNGEDSLPVIKIAQLRAGNTQEADRASVKIPSEYIINDGDVLFSWSGSLDVVLWCGGRGALNQHLFKVTSDKYPRWFYYLWTKHHLPDFQAIASAKATTMGHIQRHHLSEAEVLIPADHELKQMDAKISPLIKKIIANNIESRTHAALREALLPKLLSGALRLPLG